MQTLPRSTIVLRGYQAGAVNTLLQQAAEALASGEETQRASVRSALLRRDQPVRFRGFDRDEVDHCLSEMAGQSLAQLSRLRQRHGDAG